MNGHIQPIKSGHPVRECGMVPKISHPENPASYKKYRNVLDLNKRQRTRNFEL